MKQDTQGIEQKTLEGWAVEVTSINVRDVPMLTKLLHQITQDQHIDCFTAERCITPVNATQRQQPEIPIQSFHHIEMQSPESRPVPDLLPEKIRSARSDILVALCGDAVADPTGDAASKRRFIV